MPKKRQPMTVDQERFVRMQANGAKFPEIILEIWGKTKENTDPKEYHNLECKLSEWRKHPQYEEVWRDEVSKFDFSDYSEARKTLRKTMRNEKDQWLAMNSAVNILNQSGKRIFGSEDNTVTVKIEGAMTDIGNPETEE